MRDQTQTVLLSEPREVNVAAIEEELTTLWQRAAEPLDDDREPPVIRACSMNLMVVTDHQEELEDLTAMIGEVTVEHPARIFLVLADRSSGRPSLETWISARCTLPKPGGKQVCCEQVSVTATGQEVSKVPGILTALLVPDVPTVLLWKPEVTDHDPVLPSLIKVSDRVIIDSSEKRDPLPMLGAWHRCIERNAATTTFGDLAWTHVTGWRGMLAQVFQPEHMRTDLRAIAAVKVAYSSTVTPRHSGLAQSLMLVAWLAHVLRWTPARRVARKEHGRFEGTYRVNEDAVQVQIERREVTGDHPGSVESVRLEMRGGKVIDLHAMDRGDCVRIKTEKDDRTQETFVRAIEQSEAALVARELEILHRDPLYEESLKTLVRDLAEL